MRQMSPTSMKITHKALLAGAKMNLKDCLRMEYRLSQRCCDDHDFYEGVRALLIDKDKAPKWDPPTVEGVTQAKLDWYFAPLPSDEELILVR